MGQTKTWIAHNSLSGGVWRRFAHLSPLPCAPAVQQYYKLKNEKSGGVWGGGGSSEEDKIIEGKGRRKERIQVEIIVITKC